MSKYRYPVEGLYNPNRASLDNAKNKISSAVSVGNSLSVPSSFAYRSYLNNLKSNLTVMKEEIDVISRLLQRIDTTYKNMSIEMHNATSKLIFNDIKERERMIK